MGAAERSIWICLKCKMANDCTDLHAPPATLKCRICNFVTPAPLARPPEARRNRRHVLFRRIDP